MLNLFRSRHPLLYVVLLLYAFVLNGVLFFKDFNLPQTDQSFVFQVFNIHLENLSKPLLVSISIIIAYLLAIYINRLMINFNLSKEPSFLPAFIFITIEGIFPEMIILSPSLIGIFILTHVLYTLLTIFDIENAVQQLFFTSFFVGIGTMIYPPLAIFILLLFVAIPILKRPNWWEIAIIPFGFLMPIYLIGFGYYLMNDLNFMLELFMNSFPQWTLTFPDNYYPYMIPTTYISFLAVIAFILFSVASPNKLVRENRYQRVLTSFFINALILFVFSSASRLHIGLFLLVPVSMLISRMYVDGKRKILEISYIILILINVFMQWENFNH